MWCRLTDMNACILVAINRYPIICLVPYFHVSVCCTKIFMMNDMQSQNFFLTRDNKVIPNVCANLSFDLIADLNCRGTEVR